MSVRAHGDASTSVTTRAKATCSGVVGRPRSSAGRSGALRPALLVRAAAAEVDEGVDEHASHGSTTRRRGALATIHVASCQAAYASLFPAEYLASLSVCASSGRSTRRWRCIRVCALAWVHSYTEVDRCGPCSKRRSPCAPWTGKSLVSTRMRSSTGLRSSSVATTSTFATDLRGPTDLGWSLRRGEPRRSVKHCLVANAMPRSPTRRPATALPPSHIRRSRRSRA